MLCVVLPCSCVCAVLYSPVSWYVADAYETDDESITISSLMNLHNDIRDLVGSVFEDCELWQASIGVVVEPESVL